MRNYASLADAMQASDPRTERPFICPAHDDHNASASVNVQKGLWCCYTCGAKGKTDGLIYDQNIDLDYIDDLLAEPVPLPESKMRLYSTPHPYWLSRFSPMAIMHFQLGLDPVSGRPCYPMRAPGGELLGVVTRNVDEYGPKYRYPRGVKKNELLFNYSQVERETVILVEGAMDVIACWEAGYTAFGIYGSTFSHHQMQLLQSVAPSRVVLGFDNDHAGRKCRDGALGLLRGYDVGVIDWAKYEDYGDIGELPLEVRKTVLYELHSASVSY